MSPTMKAALKNPNAASRATKIALANRGLVTLEWMTYTYRARQGKVFGGQYITKTAQDCHATLTDAGKALVG
jgi:hypothetical protein